MFKVNKKIGYALLALKHMSVKTPGERTSAKEVCDAYKIPFDPTARVLQILAQHGILHAEQGAHGGYQLIRDITRISLKDLNDILLGPVRITSCLTGRPLSCKAMETCGVISPLLSLNEQVKNFLAEITVASLVTGRARQRPQACPAEGDGGAEGGEADD